MDQADADAAARGKSLSAASDAELAKAMASEHGDDDAAWREFWARYSDKLMRFINTRGRSLSPHDREDVFLETVGVRMPQRIANFVVGQGSSATPLLSWACRIAQNLIVDRARELKEQSEFLDVYLPVREAAEEFEISAEDSIPSRSDVDDLLERAMEQLVERDQAVLELQRAGFSDDQIAARLGIRTRLVSQVRYKALRRLERNLRRPQSE